MEWLPGKTLKKKGICGACQLGKQTKTSFKGKIAEPSTSREIELLHMDLFGVVTSNSTAGKSYTLVLVNDYSRYT